MQAWRLPKPAIRRLIAQSAGGVVEYVLSFSPWIAFGVFASALDWRVGVVAAFVIQIALARSLSRKQQLDLLSVGTLIFFGAMSGIALLRPHSSIHHWIPALSAGALAVIAGGSLLAARPFTLAIARRNTPEALWSHPEFVRLNRFLTSVWTASFAAAASACALLIWLVKNSTGPVVIANAAALGTAFYVTRRTVRSAEARASLAGLM
jgi:uncharacterized membrane protein